MSEMMRKYALLLPGVLVLSLMPLSAHEIHDSAKKGDIKTLESLLSQDSSLLNVLDNYKYTPLDWAATLAQWDAVRLLLDRGADTRNIGWDGGTVLHRACHYDNAEIVELLIERGADLKVQNQWGRTALHAAARRNCLKAVRLLIEKGADPNPTTKEGWTPLHVAAKSGHMDMMELLVSLGAKKDVQDKDGKIPSEYIFQRPAEIQIDPDKFDEYIGRYSTDSGFAVIVWEKAGRLFITDFGYDEIYSIGKDDFYCRHEPWKVTFFRNEDGEVNGMELAFLRRTQRLKKIK